jgi:HSP20 family protein
MNIIPWKNRSLQRRDGDPIVRLRDEMESVFDQFMGDWGMALFNRTPTGPSVDLAESENEVTVKAELPGVNPKDVDIRVEGNLLTIRGEKKQESEEKRRDYHYVERQYGMFHRSIQLPSSVDDSKTDARYKDGVLTITMPKRPDAKAKKVSVRTE